MRAEILTGSDVAKRGRRMLEALADTAPIRTRIRTRYVGDCELLITYGLGHPIRRPWSLRHVKSGRHCIGWDLGYWLRDLPDDAGMRCTIDTDHPPQWLRPEPPERFDALGIRLREDADPAGPVLLIGIGDKERRMRRDGPMQWERGMLAKLRQALPGREIVFRPKRRAGPLLPGMPNNTDEFIEDALRGASLVVCRHSNVAVDACIAGVPVVCENGAASALYGSDICNPRQPTQAERLNFLRSLAWWNWRPSEAAQAWKYLLNRIESG